MKTNFPRSYVSPEVRRKKIEIAREFRKEPATAEEIPLVEEDLPLALHIIRSVIRPVHQSWIWHAPTPFIGQGKGGG